MAKRLFDIIASALGLLLLAPVLLVLALWVRLDSPGPALFRQQRVGRFGKPFMIHKFRTMRVAAEQQGPLITIGADQRITAAGQVLRRYKLDELPQLWDVLRGAMSLVGPRPEVPRYVALYPEELRRIVLSVRPGITDPASLAFSAEADELAKAPDPEKAYRDSVLPRKLEMAAGYVLTAGLRSDIQLLFKTMGKLWGKR
ncbi:sugar transferase [Paucibacter sp. APW11]|uniref:Sugar transferase n=1 Tax=Roseateles aquae TaxID=3077235 RepID=A0ABU3PFA6_9BURK|nr:sugar transferase [Paucibacter sp. APW11]MDT9001241.1 sugar transferase [Paucibacter sp. APW11]